MKEDKRERMRGKKERNKQAIKSQKRKTLSVIEGWRGREREEEGGGESEEKR